MGRDATSTPTSPAPSQQSIQQVLDLEATFDDPERFVSPDDVPSHEGGGNRSESPPRSHSSSRSSRALDAGELCDSSRTLPSSSQSYMISQTPAGLRDGTKLPNSPSSGHINAPSMTHDASSIEWTPPAPRHTKRVQLLDPGDLEEKHGSDNAASEDCIISQILIPQLMRSQLSSPSITRH